MTGTTPAAAETELDGPNPLLDRISSNPQVLVGKPCIRGTRISVLQVLELLSGGRSHEQILYSFPHLRAEDIRACIAFGAEAVGKLHEARAPRDEAVRR